MTEAIEKEEHLAIENIFGKPPSWILNWGITIGFVFLMICIGLAYFIKYPDKLNMQGELILGQRPIEIVSKISGSINYLAISDKEIVKENDILLSIKSTLNEKDIEKFDTFSKVFYTIDEPLDYLNIDINKGLNFGEFTPTYTSLVQNFMEFKNYLRDNSSLVKINALKTEIDQTNKLNNSLNQQSDYYQQDVLLTEKDYYRSLNLEKDGVISLVDKEKAESKLLHEKKNLEALKASVINNDIKVQQLKVQIAEFTTERLNGINTRIYSINQEIQDLKSKIMVWESKYKIRAPISGQVAFNQSIKSNDFIIASNPIITIIPETKQNQSIIIEGLLPIKSSGTLSIGQQAIIQLENYPSNQYGVIQGIVKDISLLPNKDFYRVKIELPKGLKTSYNKELFPQPKLKASVSINTKEYSLLERIFQNIFDIAKNRNQ
ncbi:MAG: HlyD family secretion protein [Aureispira sp.]